MKKVAISIILVLFVVIGNAQTAKDSLPPYLKFPTVPPFTILLTDSTTKYIKDSLPAKTPVVVIYFSPDCGHCQIETQNIVDSMQQFKNVFFVFGAYKSINEIQAFSEKYKLNTFKNIRIGRDINYFLPVFYKVRFTPFVAVYNKKGKFVKEFPQGASIAQLKEALQL